MGVNTIVHTRQWKTIFHGSLVEILVVYEKPDFYFFIGREKY